MSQVFPATPLRPFQLGNLTVDPPLVLAPMAGATNHAFRIMCKRRGGCGLVMTEMFSAYALKYNNPAAPEMMDWTKEESPVAAQVFGGDPATVAIGARILQDAGADVIDINFGCPVPKVAKSGSGAALLRNPDMAREILIAARSAVKVPLTIKTRIGWRDGEKSVMELAKTAEICGVDMITVHGRTAQQGYSGRADWDIIAEVKASVRIPVIANGDVITPQDAAQVLSITGCDGIAIGRGALGDPWIFQRIHHYLTTGVILPEPTYAERMDAALEHARLLHDLLGERRAAREMRGHMAHYIKGMPGAPKLRQRLMRTTTLREVEEIISEARSQC